MNEYEEGPEAPEDLKEGMKALFKVPIDRLQTLEQSNFPADR